MPITLCCGGMGSLLYTEGGLAATLAFPPNRYQQHPPINYDKPKSFQACPMSLGAKPYPFPNWELLSREILSIFTDFYTCIYISIYIQSKLIISIYIQSSRKHTHPAASNTVKSKLTPYLQMKTKPYSSQIPKRGLELHKNKLAASTFQNCS